LSLVAKLTELSDVNGTLGSTPEASGLELVNWCKYSFPEILFFL